MHHSDRQTVPYALRVPNCERCGRENPDEARFCNGCGAQLAPTVAVAAEERKVVTVLFADITGSTALGERLDAERLKEVMGAFFAAMRAEIEAEGGTVEKFIGDAVMAAFGVPRVHEDDPARALRAALRMRRRLADLNEELGARYGVALELRIGINTGPVMAATDPRPGEALATGDAVNAAARIEQAAEPGQVLVAERTAQAARHFRFGAVHVLEVRGRSEPLRAVELLTDQPITEGTLSSTRAPFVGRQRELELLSSMYGRSLAEGRPHLVTLYGEAGVGKSRLVAELLAAPRSRVADAPRPARPLPGVRRRHHVLATRRDAEGARAGARHRSRRRRSRAHLRRSRGGLRLRGRRRAAGARSDTHGEYRPRRRRAFATQRAGGARRDRIWPGAPSSRHSRRALRRSCSSRTCTGRTSRCSTCSRTSRVMPPGRSSCSAPPGPS